MRSARAAFAGAPEPFVFEVQNEFFAG